MPAGLLRQCNSLMGPPHHSIPHQLQKKNLRNWRHTGHFHHNNPHCTHRDSCNMNFCKASNTVLTIHRSKLMLLWGSKSCTPSPKHLPHNNCPMTMVTHTSMAPCTNHWDGRNTSSRRHHPVQRPQFSNPLLNLSWQCPRPMWLHLYKTTCTAERHCWTHIHNSMTAVLTNHPIPEQSGLHSCFACKWHWSYILQS